MHSKQYYINKLAKITDRGLDDLSFDALLVQMNSYKISVLQHSERYPGSDDMISVRKDIFGDEIVPNTAKVSFYRRTWEYISSLQQKEEDLDYIQETIGDTLDNIALIKALEKYFNQDDVEFALSSGNNLMFYNDFIDYNISLPLSLQTASIVSKVCQLIMSEEERQEDEKR